MTWSADCIKRKLIWRKVMPPQEERRKDNENNWKEFRESMAEARAYRSADAERQLNLLSDIAEIKAQVTKTNGRVDALEDDKKKRDNTAEDKEKANANTGAVITIITAIVVAVCALITGLVMLFRK